MRMMKRVMAKMTQAELLAVWESLKGQWHEGQRTAHNSAFEELRAKHEQALAELDALRGELGSTASTAAKNVAELRVQHQSTVEELKTLRMTHETTMVEEGKRLSELRTAYDSTTEELQRTVKELDELRNGMQLGNQAASMRMLQRVMAKMRHGELLAVWDELKGRWENSRKQAAGLKMLKAAMMKIRFGELMDVWDRLRVRWEEARKQEISMRMMKRVMAKMKQAELLAVLEGWRRKYGLTCVTKPSTAARAQWLRFLFHRKFALESQRAFVQFRLHWDIERIPLFKEHVLHSEFEELSLSSLRCLLSLHLYHETAAGRSGAQADSAKGTGWDGAVDTMRRMASLEAIFQDRDESDLLFETRRSGLGFMRALMANWDSTDNEAARDTFDIGVEGAFFVFDAERMAELQDRLRQARVDADLAVIQELQQQD